MMQSTIDVFLRKTREVTEWSEVDFTGSNAIAKLCATQMPIPAYTWLWYLLAMSVVGNVLTVVVVYRTPMLLGIARHVLRTSLQNTLSFLMRDNTIMSSEVGRTEESWEHGTRQRSEMSASHIATFQNRPTDSSQLHITHSECVVIDFDSSEISCDRNIDLTRNEISVQEGTSVDIGLSSDLNPKVPSSGEW